MEQTAKKAATLGRTVVQHLALAVLLVAAAALLVRFGDIGVKMFDTIGLVFASFGSSQAMKSAYEAAKTGKGLKGDPKPEPAAGP